MRLHDLSQAARQAAETQAIRGEWEYATFEQLLKQLIAYDAAMDALIAFRLKWVVVAVILAFLGLFVGILVIGSDKAAVGWSMLLGGIVHLIVAIVLWRKAKRKDLPENALSMLQQLIRQVKQDLDPKATIRVNVDLSGPTQAKCGPKKELPANGFVSRSQYVYSDPWCQLRFQLRDGYTLTLRQVDQLIELQRTKRKARGGYKTKTKYKKLCRLTATIVPPAPVAWAGQPKVDPTWERLRVAKKKGLDVAVLDRWFLYKEKLERPKQNPSGADAVGMLYRLCSMRPAEAK
jgi:hypothetical protein